MISSPGIGSGLDINSIVSQLMAIERQPLNRLEADKRDLEAQLSAFGQLKSALSTFQGALSSLKTLDAFKVFTATSGDDTVFTATADSNAAVGVNNIEVVQLATSDKLTSVAFADTDTTTVGGAGDTMDITVNGKSFTVNGGGLTLTQLRDAINNDPNNVGVSATILSETPTSNRLILTSNNTGAANAISTVFTGTLGTDLGLTQTVVPVDAQIKVDGFTVTRSSNVISDAISGVTLTLNKTTATGVTVPLTIARDPDTIKANVQSFVDAFNTLRSTFDSLRGNELQADSTLRSIESGIQDVLNTPPSGLITSLSYLSEVGVSIQKDGTLAFDGTVFDTAIANDFAGVADLFANDDQGFLFRLDSLVTGYVQTSGLIDAREDGLNDRIDSVDDRIADMEFRLGLTEQRLRKQFTALDTLLGQLNGTSSFLTQQLALLNNSK